MQIPQVLVLAFAATALAKIWDDNTIIPASVKHPANSPTIQSGPPEAVVSAKLRRHPKALQARDSTLYVCEHANWGGACATWGGLGNQVCYNVPSAWNDVISSTDTYGHTCTFFEHAGCTGDQSTVNGGVNWGYMNDKITSFRCYG